MKALPLALLSMAASIPSQHVQSVPGAQPPAGAELLVYDASRDRTVAFIGTSSASQTSSTWEHDGFSWSQVVTANAPSDRYDYAMAYDGQRVLLYGGQATNGGVLSDLWAFDGTDWTLLTSGAGPGARRSAAMAYDPARGRTVLFGGVQPPSFPNDTWEWDGASWTLVHTSGPGPRVWHRMVYDEARQRCVMGGGAFNPVVYVDTWEWDGSSWVQTVANGFPYGTMPMLVFDRSTQHTLAIGGVESLLGVPRNEIWAYDPVNSTWNLRTTTPAFESFTCAAYDSARERTLILTSDPLSGGAADFYYWDQGSGAATFTAFGQGCSGGQPPSLAAAPGSAPTIGTTFTVEVNNTGAAILAALAVGWSRTQWNGTPLPASLAPAGFHGCSLLVSAETVVSMTLQAGVASASWPIPNNTSLKGAVFFEQALLLDPTAVNGLGVATNGAIGVVQ